MRGKLLYARFWFLVLQKSELFVKNVCVDAVAFKHLEELVVLEPLTTAAVLTHADIQHTSSTPLIIIINYHQCDI